MAEEYNATLRVHNGTDWDEYNPKTTAAQVKGLVDAIYPVGIITYFGNSADPNTLFEGTTWERITDRVLAGYNPSGGTYGTLGADIGSDTVNFSHYHSTAGHTLTIDEIPAHRHYTFTGNGSGNKRVYAFTDASTVWESWGDSSTMWGTLTGGSQSHTHGNTGSSLGNTSMIQQTRVVGIWMRTA